MNLRESLERWNDGMDDPLEGREVILYARGYINGFAESRGLRLGTSTNGPTMRIHDIGADTRSAVISRANISNSRELITALRAQLDAHPFWGPEPDDWGPDPWASGEDVRRE